MPHSTVDTRELDHDVGGKYPSVSCTKLLRILKKHCGEPVRIKGSHHIFISPYNGQQVLLAYHRKEMWGTHVRALLVTQLGLSEEAALREVSR